MREAPGLVDNLYYIMPHYRRQFRGPGSSACSFASTISWPGAGLGVISRASPCCAGCRGCAGNAWWAVPVFRRGYR